MRQIVSLILWYLPVALVQLIAGQASVGSISPWYKNLKKASWTPPDWVFSPIWTLLYVIMAVSLWMIYRTNATKRAHFLAYVLFFSQLFANGLWSLLFFRFHMIGWACIELGGLILLIVATMISFFFHTSTSSPSTLPLPFLVSLCSFSQSRDLVLELGNTRGYYKKNLMKHE